jgi:hypothetical protein
MVICRSSFAPLAQEAASPRDPAVKKLIASSTAGKQPSMSQMG